MNYPHYDSSPSPELVDWMRRKRAQRLIKTIEAQIARARGRGFKKTQVTPDDLELLINMTKKETNP